MRITRARATLAVLAGTAATALAACSSGGTATPQGSASRTTAPVAAASASASPSTPAQLALAAYTAMWRDVQAVGMTSNYQDPRLADHMQGQPLVTFRENISVDQAHGVVGRGAPVLNPSVITATATTVTLRDCLSDQNWIKVYAATGKPVDDIPGGHRHVAATVSDVNGSWMVTSLDVGAEGTCT